ncbi:MAG: GTP cyclohydrolase I FolE [Verrucomicrobia bacterium GWF2_62_7]|nr:MAG: GTP cyclohydrolase I FolE [Verrucomicrobia bacterium GWF2_62_7]
MIRKVDQNKIEKAMREILEAVGEDPDREGLRETPARVARMYAEIFGHGDQDPREALGATFTEDHHEVVLVKDIPFYSMCEHHFMPFFGKAHVAYIPKGKIVGISKLARVVEAYARRPQVQERMTSQIADLVNEMLRPNGVAVIIEAIHTCMTMRGVKKAGTSVVTSAMRGDFRKRITTRTEIMSLIYGRPMTP